MGELDAELGEAGVDPGVAAVEMRVPEEAGVEDAGEARGERPAHGDAAAAVGHGEAVPGVLRRGLGARAEVPRLAPVVPGERVQEVREDERGVVVGEHEPPRRGRRRVVVVVELQELLGDARDADGGGEPARVRVREAGGVGGGDAEAEVGRQWLGRGGGGRAGPSRKRNARAAGGARGGAAGGGAAACGGRRRCRTPRAPASSSSSPWAPKTTPLAARRLVVAPRGGGGGEEGGGGEGWGRWMRRRRRSERRGRERRSGRRGRRGRDGGVGAMARRGERRRGLRLSVGMCIWTFWSEVGKKTNRLSF